MSTTESTEENSAVEKESRKADEEGWLTKTRIGLITGGFALLLCICAIIMIAMLRSVSPCRNHVHVSFCTNYLLDSDLMKRDGFLRCLA